MHYPSEDRGYLQAYRENVGMHLHIKLSWGNVSGGNALALQV